MYVLNQDTLVEQAVIDIGVGGPFSAPKIALYTNDIFPARGLLIGAYTFADFAGLTNQKSVTWGVPFLNQFQQAEVWATAVLNWLTLSVPTSPVTAYGYVMLNTAANAWILAERFAVPRVFNGAGQQLGVMPRLIWN